MFEGLDDDRVLTIFDAGPAHPESVAFYNRFRCRLYFAGLVGEDEVLDRSALEELLDYPRDTRFDVCLFWDYLNYLDIEALSEFEDALCPFLHDATRAHAYVAFGHQTPLFASRYGIQDVGRLAVRGTTSLVPHPHSQRDVANAWSRFSVRRAMLLPDNRQELFLVRS